MLYDFIVSSQCEIAKLHCKYVKEKNTGQSYMFFNASHSCFYTNTSDNISSPHEIGIFRPGGRGQRTGRPDGRADERASKQADPPADPAGGPERSGGAVAQRH